MNLEHDLHPHLLYRIEGAQARFATWKLETGHEALALFTTNETAVAFQAELEAADWKVFQPPRDRLVQVLQSCKQIGIAYAALDPLAGRAKTLFDIPRVLAAAATQ